MNIEIASILRAVAFLGIPFIFAVFYLQWKWARACDRNIQVLVAQQGGGGKFFLAPKSGGEVSIKSPQTNEVRIWPINELSTIDVTYPGVGFLPRFLQKSIRLAIVNEGDWEPMLNRSPHRKKVASPDVIEFLADVAVKSDDSIRKQIATFVKEISTGPTREMIADPATLGSLRQSSIMKALATVSDELIESIEKLKTQLSRVASINPTLIYIGLLLIIALTGFIVFKVNAGDMATMSEQLRQIQEALGIQP